MKAPKKAAKKKAAPKKVAKKGPKVVQTIVGYDILLPSGYLEGLFAGTNEQTARDKRNWPEDEVVRVTIERFKR